MKFTKLMGEGLQSNNKTHSEVACFSVCNINAEIPLSEFQTEVKTFKM